MRILIINYEFPPVGGGGGRLAADVGAELADRGHRVAVLTSHLKGLAKTENSRGMTIHRVRCGRRRADRCTVPEMAGFVAASLLPAWLLTRRWRPDVMHVHFGVPTGVTAWLVSRLTRVPYVLTSHLGDVPGAGGSASRTDHLFRFVKPLTVPIWRQAADVTAVSDQVIPLCEWAYGITPRVIPNGVDPARYEARETPPSRPIRLLWVGRLQEEKNLAFGLRQLATLDDLEWTLDVVGDGPEKAVVREVATAGGLADRVRFHGWLTEPDVRQHLHAADVLYLPSRYEGLPMVALQALASGLAIVASRVGSLPAVVEDDVNGLLCDLDRPETFRRALRRVTTDLPLLERMQKASRRQASSFSLQATVDRYEAVLRDVVERQCAP